MRTDALRAIGQALFWVHNEQDELLEMRFEFPFNLIGKLAKAFL